MSLTIDLGINVSADTTPTTLYGRNLLRYSQQFNTSPWATAVATVTADQAVAPDSTTTADKVVVNNLQNSGNVYQTVTKTTSAIQYTWSVYAKVAEWNSIGVYLQGGSFTNRASVIANVSTGTIGAAAVNGTYTNASASITSIGSGWYRIALTATTGPEASVQAFAYPGNNSTFPNGNGTNGIYVWGGQLEYGSAATAYKLTV